MKLKSISLHELLTDLNIDQNVIDEIVKPPFANHQLTFAESIVVYEGIKTGEADCRISAKEKELKQIEDYHQYVCAELLERLLMPQIAAKIFTKTKLTIQGVGIYRLADLVRVREGKIIKENHALNLHDTIINIDLTFKDCTFVGGINLQGATTRNLIFERPRFHTAINTLNNELESFIGINLYVRGSLIFTMKNTESHNADKSHPMIDLSRKARRDEEKTNNFWGFKEDKNFWEIKDDKQNESENLIDFQFKGSVNLQHAKIDDKLEFYSVNINGHLKCDYAQINRLIFNADEFSDYENVSRPEECIIKGNININEASFQQGIHLQVLKVTGSISGYHLRSGQFFIYSATINGKLDLTFAEIEHLLSLQESKIVGVIDAMSDSQEYSIQASGLIAGNIFMRSGLKIANGIRLYRCVVKDSIDFSGSLVMAAYPDNEAINLIGGKIGNDIQFSSGTVIIGTLFLEDASVGRNIYFSGCKLLNKYPENYKKGDTVNKSVSAKNAYIGKSIFFSPMSKNLNKTVFRRLQIEGERTKDIIDKKVPFPDQFRSVAVEMKKQLISNSKNKLTRTVKSYGPRHLRSEAINEYINSKCNIFFDSIDNHEFFLSDAMRCYENAIKYLKITTEIENGIELSDIELAELLLETTISVGNISFTGIHVSGQIDLSSALLYTLAGVQEIPDHKNRIRLIRFIKKLTEKRVYKKSTDYPNALTMKFSNINGELFLNEGIESNLERMGRIASFPFRACGEVNLHSSKIGQFFISPRRGCAENSKWKVIGVKYSYIYSNEPAARISLLERCDWFYNYGEENNRQPYEELAAAYLRAGDDTKARKVLLRVIPRNGYEQLTLWILRGVSWLGIPHYKSLLWLVGLFFAGWIVFTQSGNTGGIIPISKTASVEINKSEPAATIFFSGGAYSFQHMMPFLSLGQKEAFATTIYSGRNFFPDWIPLYADSGVFTSTYLFFHVTLSLLFLSMFIIGITRIIKRS
ncbi:hypothetical protein FHS59_003496 [Algoriphagus iocasae]|uniref:Uncharacterized protein n=1 Tax=Algoriphagus iocasae TaxID=1836499 RepID=A0A841MLU4_9BACT|nr:hypothetical protein [Algoriphagus iocasae]MBB6327853.1 hypothetical protein [Algoriphagus iocasae]